MSREIVHRKKRPVTPANAATVTAETPPLTPENLPAEARPRYIIPLVIALLTIIVYLPALKNQFTNWDDQAYAINYPLYKNFTLSSIKEMFFSSDPHLRYWMGNYHPLTMLTLAINHQMFQKDGKPVPWIFILTNILLHAINTILVFLIIFRLSKNNFISLAVALLFGVHTLHVESVAWIAERKDVLYTLFYLWSLLIYIKYVNKNKLSLYLVSLFLFILSLLSKGQAVSLALSIILIDIFYKRRIFSLKVVAEKLPYLILALIFGLIAIEAQKNSSALQTSDMYPLFKRIGIASYAYAVYLFKLFLPIHLSAIYPYPDIVHKTIPFYYYLFAIVDLAVLWLMYLWYRRGRMLPALGIAFFTVNIAFLLQLIPVGSAIYADRYTYIPSIGFYLTISYFLTKIKEKKSSVAISILAAYSLLLIFLTISRIKVWHDSKSLWTDTIAKTPKAVVAWNNLGSVISEEAKAAKEKGRIDRSIILYRQAIEHYNKAIERKPDYSSAFYNRAVSEYEIGRALNDTDLVWKAIDDLNNAITVKLDFKEAFLQRGVAYDWLNKLALAYNDYKRVLELDPHNTKVLINMGIYYGKKQMYDTAIAYFNRALKKDPTMAEALSNRGLAYMLKGNLDSALKDFNKAISLDSSKASTFYNRSLVYIRKKQYPKALADLNKAIQLMPNNPEFYFVRGNVYLTIKRTADACKNYSLAAQYKYAPAIKALRKYCRK